MVKPKPYPHIRAGMTREGIDQEYLCELMKRSQFYITKRITGKEPWTQDEMYFLMDLFDIPYDQMHIVFPKNGIDRGEYEIKGGAA